MITVTPKMVDAAYKSLADAASGAGIMALPFDKRDIKAALIAAIAAALDAQGDLCSAHEVQFGRSLQRRATETKTQTEKLRRK